MSTIDILKFKDTKRAWLSLNSSSDSSEFKFCESISFQLIWPIVFIIYSTISGCRSFKEAILFTETPVFHSTFVLNTSKLNSGLKLNYFHEPIPSESTYSIAPPTRHIVVSIPLALFPWAIISPLSESNFTQ